MLLLTGKAGGFLALDWTDELARVSYALHQDLAATLKADIGYRPVQSIAVSATASKQASTKRRGSKLPDWLDGNVSGGQVWLSLLLWLCPRHVFCFCCTLLHGELEQKPQVSS